MKKQYIKHPIPEQISEDGGASIVFVNKQTVPLDGSITEALEGNYCTGQKTLIRNFFFGLLQSMADGVRRDGHARQIANFLTVYPVFKGEVDLDRGFDPEKNSVMIRARLLNEMDLDITGWSFEDVTPGKRSFKLDSVKAGEVIGVVKVFEAVALNGKELPSTAAGEELRVHWEVEGTEKSGDVPAAKMTSDVSRIDIDASALAELADATYDGKKIVFTVRGNFSSAKIAATLKYIAPEGPYLTDKSPITKLKIDGDNLTLFGLNLPDNWNEENYKLLVGSAYTPDEEPSVAAFPKSLIRDTSDPTKIELDFAEFVNGEYGVEGREIVPGGVYPFTFQVNMDGALSNVLSFNLIGEA